MLCVVSRVSGASLSVEGKEVSSIGLGLIIYVCSERGDIPADGEKLAHKCAGLRIFEDSDGKMNLSPAQVGGEILVVSNFTLAGDCVHGFRPGFSGAEDPAKAAPAVAAFAEAIRREGIPCKEGVFGADMHIANTALGPITLLLRAREGKLLSL